LTSCQCLFPGHFGPDRPLTTRRYARLVSVGPGHWSRPVELRHAFDAPDQAHAHLSAHGKLRAVQLLLGHQKSESTVRYLGVEVDDALEIAEKLEVCNTWAELPRSAHTSKRRKCARSRRDSRQVCSRQQSLSEPREANLRENARTGRQHIIRVELLLSGGEPLQDVWPVVFEPLLLGQDWTVRRIDLAAGCQHARQQGVGRS